MRHRIDTKTVVLIAKHARWVRWSHWLNFPLWSLMIWSGILIYWANPAYTPLIPDSFYEALGLDHHLAFGMGVHFFVMWLFALNGLAYGLYLVVTGQWREMWPRPRHFAEAWLVVLHDLGLQKTLPPQGKYNAAQRVAYTGVILMGSLSLLSGIAIYKPVQLHPLASLLGGYESARLIHFLMAIGFVLFFIVHVVQVTRAGWNNFRSMIAGFEVRRGTRSESR